MIVGKLELTIKINELPQPKPVENDEQEFKIDYDGRIILIIVKSKIGKKLTDTAGNYSQWIAPMSNDKPQSVYAGQLGHQTEQWFVLEKPNLQVFERKNKAETNSLVSTP